MNGRVPYACTAAGACREHHIRSVGPRRHFLVGTRSDHLQLLPEQRLLRTHRTFVGHKLPLRPPEDNPSTRPTPPINAER